MKKSFTPIIVGVLIIAAVAYFAMGGNDNEKSSQEVDEPTGVTTQSVQVIPSEAPGATMLAPSVGPAKAQSASVEITDEGFVPAVSTIKAGTTVVFTNNGQALHQPASDPHPTHTNVAGFDAKRGLSTGETYSFTFTKPGTFGLHDHLHAALKGSIVVQ